MSSIRMKSYIQPFERTLALRELDEFLGTASGRPPEGDGTYSIPTAAMPAAAARLVYWDRFGDDSYTDQVYREATSLIARNGAALAELPKLSRGHIKAKIPRSRCLRYGPHGIHEYRGKFFPQLVKALINIAGIDEGATVLDPMCGSGTTLVEAAAAGHRAIGIDMNPLSVFVSSTKCDSLRLQPSQIIAGYDELVKGLQSSAIFQSVSHRPALDQKYLSEWFAPDVLIELDRIDGALQRLESRKIAQLFRVSLSNILRRVSFQKEVDLRVRRETKEIRAGEPTRLFLEECLRSAKSVAAYLLHGQVETRGRGFAAGGDARTFVNDGTIRRREVDLVITSPPYATALPYLDTDRLSLSYLGLLSRSHHRMRDQDMIGNREITERIRREHWARYLVEAKTLPAAVRALIDQVENENSNGEVGFRRRNLGALLAIYFLDMTAVFQQIHLALKPGAQAFVVVGNNRTRTPTGEVEIRTSQLLLTIAEQMRFGGCERMEMEMLSSRDIFKENRTPSEHIIMLRRQK